MEINISPLAEIRELRATEAAQRNRLLLQQQAIVALEAALAARDTAISELRAKVAALTPPDDSPEGEPA